MAKKAKQIEMTVSDREVKTFVADVLDHLAEIESARGTFMNFARRKREGMSSIYEMMAAKGVPQKVSRAEIKIIVLIQRIQKLVAELETDQRKMLEKLAKAQGDRRQLSLWANLPTATKPKKPKAGKAEAAPDNVVPLSSAQPESPTAA